MTTMTIDQLRENLRYAEHMAAIYANQGTCGYEDAAAEYREYAKLCKAELARREQ